MAREEDLKRSGAWDWELQRPREINTAENRRLQLGTEGDYKSEIIELVEKYYGSGKAMQVADILKDGE